MLCIVAGSAASAGVLTFSTASGSIDGVATAEVRADGLVLLRLRGSDAEALAGKTQTVAQRLTHLALEGLTSGDVAVARVGGQWGVTGRGDLIITADADTARASGLQPRDLCESWRARIAQVLREPYLTVEPDECVLVPVGERRTVRVGGTLEAAATVETMAADVVAAVFDPQSGEAHLRGLQTGTTVLSIRAGAVEYALTVEVKPWAARMTEHAQARLLGGGVSEEMGEIAAVNAALVAIDPAPRATVRLVERTATAGGYVIALRAGGSEYIPVSGTVEVSLRGALPAIPDAEALLISNVPEKVTGVGALMRQALRTGRPARLMWHHKNYTGRPVVVAVRLLNAGDKTGRVRVGWADAGPGPDEIFVGFNAMLRYWHMVRPGSGFEAVIPPGRGFETSAIELSAHDVVSGMMELVADAGDGLYVEVAARDPQDAPAGFAQVPHRGEEMPVTPFEFAARMEHEVSYEVGGRFAHLSIGRDDVVNEEGIALAGAYGVMHRTQVEMCNPRDEPARAEVALRAGGGVARVVAAIDGSVACSRLLRAGQEEVLARRDLGPGERRRMHVELIPTAGSNLPLTLVVRGRTR